MRNKQLIKERLAYSFALKNSEYEGEQHNNCQAFVAGFEAGEKTSQNTFHFELGYKSTQKKVKDKLNSLKSKLSEEQTAKLSKVLNKDKIEALKGQIQILKELL